MKMALTRTFVLLFALLATAATVRAESRRSLTTKDRLVSLGRVVKVVPLVDKMAQKGLAVNAIVVDHGGSTDMSPTQTVFLTIYQKGEMYSTDLAFKIADVMVFSGATRIRGGVYVLKTNEFEDKTGKMRNVSYRIDAQKALAEIQAFRCPPEDDMDCAASARFASTIDVVRQ
jgi:hypothetical protein